MSTIIKFSRTFAQPIAKPRDRVSVTTKISFISPFFPSANTWFNNIGDNLGGSKLSNGPLHYFLGVSKTTTNLTPSTIQYAATGDDSSNGCMRYWAVGASYPSPTTPLSDVWKPINPNTYTEMIIKNDYFVDANAVIGTIITLPTRANSNYDANRMMIDLGSDFILVIDNTGMTGSDTLTIVS